MNEIVELKTRSVPTAIDQRLWSSLRYFHNSLDPVDGSLPSDRVPSPEARRALIARRDAIVQWLRPCGHELAVPEILSVLGTLAMRSGSVGDLKATISIYANDLADVPYFALSKACADFRQGRAGDGHWAPTQAEIRSVALRYVAELAKEERELDTVIRAPIQRPKASPERMSQLEAHIAETKRQLAAFSAKENAQDRERSAPRHPWFKARIEAQQPKPIDHSAPVTLSPEASSRFTRMQEVGE